MKKIIEIYKLEELPVKLEAEEETHKIYYFYHKGSVEKPSIQLILNCKNSLLELKGALIADSRDKVTLSTNTIHITGENAARVHIKTVLSGKSIFSFTGMIRINKGASLSDSFLQQDNLVVSPDAICNSTPQLEIEDDNVKASHGVTVGSFDSSQIFYMKSRGLSEQTARDIISESFLADVYKENSKSVMSKLNIKSLI